MNKKQTSAPKSPPVLPADPLDRRYQKPFLDKVICRLDFNGSLEFPDDKLPLQIKRYLQKPFPLDEEELTVNTNVALTDGQLNASTSKRKVWKFSTAAKTKTITVSTDFIIAEYSKYDSFGPFLKEFMGAVKAVLKQAPEMTISRLGLRYIDKIDLKDETDPLKWNDYLREELLAWQRIIDDPTKVIRAVHVLESRYDDFQVKIQYGMMNPDYPAPIRRKVYVIDTDGFSAGPINQDAAEDLLRKIRAKIKTTWESFIRDGLRHKMGIRA